MQIGISDIIFRKSKVPARQRLWIETTKQTQNIASGLTYLFD